MEDIVKNLLIAVTAALASGSLAYAQEAAPKPDTNVIQAPTNQMEQASPDLDPSQRIRQTRWAQQLRR